MLTKMKHNEQMITWLIRGRSVDEWRTQAAHVIFLTISSAS